MSNRAPRRPSDLRRNDLDRPSAGASWRAGQARTPLATMFGIRVLCNRGLSSALTAITWNRTARADSSGVQLMQHRGLRLRAGRGCTWQATGRAAVRHCPATEVPGAMYRASGHDASSQRTFPVRLSERGVGNLASSRIHRQLETDGDALPSDVPMRISLVSPGFPPQLGGVEVVVGCLADGLRGHGHQVTVYAQRPRGSSFPAPQHYPSAPVCRLEWLPAVSGRARARPRAVARQRAV